MSRKEQMKKYLTLLFDLTKEQLNILSEEELLRYEASVKEYARDHSWKEVMIYIGSSEEAKKEGQFSSRYAEELQLIHQKLTAEFGDFLNGDEFQSRFKELFAKIAPEFSDKIDDQQTSYENITAYFAMIWHERNYVEQRKACALQAIEELLATESLTA
jgi:hypothetical protein